MNQDNDSGEIQSLLQQAHDVPSPEPAFVQGLGERLAQEFTGMQRGPSRVPAPRRWRWLLIPAAAAALLLVAVAAHFFGWWGSDRPLDKEMEFVQIKSNVQQDMPVLKRPSPSSKQLSKEKEKVGRLLALREESLEKRVAAAQVIVVARALDAAPARPNRPGDLPEVFIRFQVTRVLKGQLAAMVITTRTPTAADEFIGKDWVLLLSPEYMAGQHQFADCNWIKAEPEVMAVLAKMRGAVAAEAKPTASKSLPQERVEPLRRKSLDQCVAEAQVIVVAMALDSAPAPPNVPGDLPENYIRFRVTRVLKGNLVAKVITTRTPTDAKEFIGKEWVILLSPEYLAGKHFYARSYTINVEARVKGILAKGK
jgi:hypothetical protein